MRDLDGSVPKAPSAENPGVCSTMASLAQSGSGACPTCGDLDDQRLVNRWRTGSGVTTTGRAATVGVPEGMACAMAFQVGSRTNACDSSPAQMRAYLQRARTYNPPGTESASVNVN